MKRGDRHSGMGIREGHVRIEAVADAVTVLPSAVVAVALLRLW